MLETLFWICVIGSAYSYLLYPLSLMLLPRRGIRITAVASDFCPPVSLIIACRNEEARLRHKLDNTLAIDYPQLEVLVASDASDDRSDAIVGEYSGTGVRLVRSPQRHGKEHAQALAIQAASHDIIVFTDAGTDVPPQAIRTMVSNFSNPRVGAVSSEDSFVTRDGKVAGEGAYVRYEMWLRRLEAGVNSLIGLSGSFFATRREVLREWDTTIPSDFACAINTVRAGLVAVPDPRVRGIYRDLKDPSQEYRRKVRTAVGGMAALERIPEVLNPSRYGLFAYQLMAHKVMRWLVPWFLLAVLATSALLAPSSGFFRGVLWLQLAGYGVVAAAHWIAALRGVGPIRIAYYFVQVNVALAHAGLKFLGGERARTWDPSVR